jgi:hypothetical protein
VARGFAKFGVLPDPVDVGSECLAQPIEALPERRLVVEEDEVEMRESASGTSVSSTRRNTTGAKRLLSEAANATSLAQTGEATASELSTKMTVSACAISA